MNTVRVRIPVAVASNGEYSSYRWSRIEEEESLETVRLSASKFHRGCAQRIVWIEADVTVPDADMAKVEGKVVS